MSLPFNAVPKKVGFFFAITKGTNLLVVCSIHPYGYSNKYLAESGIVLNKPVANETCTNDFSLFIFSEKFIGYDLSFSPTVQFI